MTQLKERFCDVSNVRVCDLRQLQDVTSDPCRGEKCRTRIFPELKPSPPPFYFTLLAKIKCIVVKGRVTQRGVGGS